MVGRGGWSNVMHLIGLGIEDIDALVGIVTFTMKPGYIFDHPRKMQNLLIHPKRENICGFCFLASGKFAEKVRTSWQLIAQQNYVIFFVDNIAYLSKKYHFVCAI